MSTVSDDGGLDDAELQLGLGLGISGSGNKAMMVETRNMASSSSSGCSSASSSSLDRADADAGVKRIADFSADSAGVNLVVGWPPVRAYRISTMGNRINFASKPEFDLNLRTSESGGPLINNLIKGCGNKDGAPEKERGTISPYVKVNMDGYPIGRKVDLSSFNCYETLARTLEGMFVNFQQSTSVSIGSDQEKNMTRETRHPASKLLIGSSEFVLTYEDKDGDWMLVGDVPWRMFCNSVKRLRITRTSDANVPDM